MQTHDAQTTTLTTIRNFLRAERREPPPWAPPSRAVDELYALLRERRGDDLFWLRLSDLATRLEDRRFSSVALARSDGLDGATVDRLLEDLRSSLGGGYTEPRKTLKDWLGSAISAAALAGFLLLGTATSCAEDDDDAGADADSDSDSDSDSDADELCDEAIDEGFSGEEGDVYCDLIEIIENADVPDWVKQDLYDCLPDLDAALRESLLEQFQEMTGTELSAYLDNMVDLGAICGDDIDAH